MKSSCIIISLLFQASKFTTAAPPIALQQLSPLQPANNNSITAALTTTTLNATELTLPPSTPFSHSVPGTDLIITFTSTPHLYPLSYGSIPALSAIAQARAEAHSHARQPDQPAVYINDYDSVRKVWKSQSPSTLVGQQAVLTFVSRVETTWEELEGSLLLAEGFSRTWVGWGFKYEIYRWGNRRQDLGTVSLGREK